jgi:hypothetical protein
MVTLNETVFWLQNISAATEPVATLAASHVVLEQVTVDGGRATNSSAYGMLSFLS